MGKKWFGDVFGNNVPQIRFSTSGNPNKHMPIGYRSFWGQQRSATLVDLSWPWNSHDARSWVTASPISHQSYQLAPFKSIAPGHAKLRLLTISLNLAEGCSSYDAITSWPDLTKFCFHQKLRKRRPISYGTFQHDTPNGVASSSEKLMGVHHPPPLHWRGLNLSTSCAIWVWFAFTRQIRWCQNIISFKSKTSSKKTFLLKWHLLSFVTSDD